LGQIDLKQNENRDTVINGRTRDKIIKDL
jgi:hypothetical protein